MTNTDMVGFLCPGPSVPHRSTHLLVTTVEARPGGCAVHHSLPYTLQRGRAGIQTQALYSGAHDLTQVTLPFHGNNDNVENHKSQHLMGPECVR